MEKQARGKTISSSIEVAANMGASFYNRFCLLISLVKRAAGKRDCYCLLYS